MLCTGCTMHTATDSCTHMERGVPPQEYKAGKAEVKAKLTASCDPALALSKAT